MKILFVLFVFGLLAASTAYAVPRLEKATTRIPHSYIIKLKDTISLHGFVQTFQGAFSEGRIRYKWDRLNSLAVSLPDELQKHLLELDGIYYVEEDGIFYSQAVGSWGIDRVDQRNLPLNNAYNAPRTGSGQTVYVVDTGIHHTHSDFGGRSSFQFDFQDHNGARDCNGHGTHMAGVIGGATYGICKSCTLKSVRALNCQGSGSTTNLVAGIASIPNNGGVGSVSIGGGASTTLDNAVTDAINRGIVMVVSAGNDNTDACYYSPSRAAAAITVGATQNDDSRSPYSNWGNCLDIFAPGSDITSAWYTSDTATYTMSGTSSACGHATGAAALFLAKGVAASGVPNAMVFDGTSGVIKNRGLDSPNVLLYTA